MGELGFAYLRLGNYTKAIEYEQQLLAFAREIQNRQVEGAALGNLGFAYLRLGNYTKAIEYTQQWLAITRERQDHRYEQVALNILGSDCILNLATMPKQLSTLSSGWRLPAKYKTA